LHGESERRPAEDHPAEPSDLGARSHGIPVNPVTIWHGLAITLTGMFQVI